MLVFQQQALIEAPVERIWELVGNPKNHPEWWPDVIEVRGGSFQVGDAYMQVTDGPTGRMETEFHVEARDELREIKMQCQATRTFAHWVLTPAQGNTFVDVTFGTNEQGSPLLGSGELRPYFRRWLEQSLAALQEASIEPELSRND